MPNSQRRTNGGGKNGGESHTTSNAGDLIPAMSIEQYMMAANLSLQLSAHWVKVGDGYRLRITVGSWFVDVGRDAKDEHWYVIRKGDENLVLPLMAEFPKGSRLLAVIDVSSEPSKKSWGVCLRDPIYVKSRNHATIPWTPPQAPANE